MRKRTAISLLLALALCAGLMAVPALAYDMGKAGESNIISTGGATGFIDQNGVLWMWGNNDSGQLGNGTTTDSTTPVNVLEDVAAVSYGGGCTAAIRRDGTLWMWGNNYNGRLGNGGGGNATDEYGHPIQTVPVKVLDGVAAVSCEGECTAAIKTDGSLWMWGYNHDGKLGNGTNWGDYLVPVKVLDNVAAVSCGGSYTAAIRRDGTLWMWGANYDSQLGNGTTEDSFVPVKVLDNVAAVSCGWYHTAVIKTDGSLWTWGRNDAGELGNGGGGNAPDFYGDYIIQSVPVKVLEDVAAVSCGWNHTAAIKTDGTLWMWGSNSNSELGNGTTEDSSVPVKVLDGVAAVSCELGCTAAVKTDGTVWTWGSNNHGQLGYEGGNSERDSWPIQTVPRQVMGLTGTKTVRIYLNGGTGTGTLWTSADGTIQVPVSPTKPGYTFGGWYTDEALTIPWNFNDEVTGTLVLYARWMPITTVSETTGQRSIISAGVYHTGVIDQNGALWMWGFNGTGELGNGTAKNSSVPVKVLEDMMDMSCGFQYTAAIKADGALWTWGRNEKGQLGNGTTERSFVPVKVLDNVAAVSCGWNHTAAIKTDGTLWMWGSNSSGQLGNGGSGNATDEYGYPIQSVPVKVLEEVAAVSCGSYYTAALKTDGSLWTWGWNEYGQLGNGTEENSSVPVKVLEDVATVSCGRGHTAAIKTDGTLWTWGDNGQDQLGNGTMKTSNIPVKVMEDVVAVSCGDYHTAAIRTGGTLWMWGWDFYGELGGGHQKSSSVLVKVMENVAAVSCGDDHTAALKTDGTVWTWGRNDRGQLGYEGGNSTRTSIPIQTVPRQVTGLTGPKGVRIYLNGGTGTGTLWTDATGTIKVPTNPTREGYTFGGWYTDEALTIPWNFNSQVTGTLRLYARWMPITTVSETAGQSLTTITMNGSTVSVQTGVLQDANGNGANYVKLRDIAALLDGTSAQFNVDYRNGAIYVDSGRAYTTRNGAELKPIQGCDGSYMWNVNPVLFDGVTAPLEGIVLTDGDGGGHTFFKLRDLADALGFTVEWTPEQGVTIKTN